MSTMILIRVMKISRRRKRLKRGKQPEIKNSNADKTIAEWEEALNPDLTNELLSDSEPRDLGDFL